MADQDALAQLPMFDRSPRATTFVRWTLPLSALLGLLVSIPIVFPSRAADFAGLLVTYVVPPAGKESVIPAAVAAGFSPFLVATYIAGVDMTIAWLLAWNWESLIRLPKAGELIDSLMRSGREWLDRNPIADRSAFVALVAFVFFPLQGSGAVAGITVSRLIGIPPQRAWVAVMIGALTAAFLWAYAAGAVRAAVGIFGFEAVLQAAVVLIASAALVGLTVRRIVRG